MIMPKIHLQSNPRRADRQDRVQSAGRGEALTCVGYDPEERRVQTAVQATPTYIYIHIAPHWSVSTHGLRSGGGWEVTDRERGPVAAAGECKEPPRPPPCCFPAPHLTP